jgi:hypothetical protein
MLGSCGVELRDTCVEMLVDGMNWKIEPKNSEGIFRNGFLCILEKLNLTNIAIDETINF